MIGIAHYMVHHRQNLQVQGSACGSYDETGFEQIEVISGENIQEPQSKS